MAVSKKRKKAPSSEEGWKRRQVSNRKALAWVLTIPALGLGLFLVLQLDGGGKVERAEATVVSTSSYDHTNSEGTHQHTAAVVELEGTTATLKPADGAVPGALLPVRISRGKLTGQLKILGLYAPPAAPTGGGSPLVPVDLPGAP